MNQSVESAFKRYGTLPDDTTIPSRKSTPIPELHGLPLIHFFLDKDVVLKIHHLTVKGKLLFYRFERKDPLGNVVFPEVLILQQPYRRVIVRGTPRAIILDQAPSAQGSGSSAALQKYKKKSGFKERR